MVKNVLNAIGGVEVYGIISVCLFFLVFTGSLFLALLKTGASCRKMSVLPLSDGSFENTANEEPSHE